MYENYIILKWKNFITTAKPKEIIIVLVGNVFLY